MGHSLHSPSPFSVAGRGEAKQKIRYLQERFHR